MKQRLLGRHVVDLSNVFRHTRPRALLSGSSTLSLGRWFHKITAQEEVSLQVVAEVGMTKSKTTREVGVFASGSKPETAIEVIHADSRIPSTE